MIVGLLLLLISGTVLLAGCAGPSDELRVSELDNPMVWPAPPEQARIRYTKAIHNASDIGAGRGFFSRLAAVLLGARTTNIIKPYGIVTDSTGRMIVADTAIGRIHIFDLKKKKYSKIKRAGKVGLLTPIAVAVDSADNIYVTDSAAAKVYAFNRKGRFLFAFNAGTRPTGIAVDKAAARLYVVDTGAHEVGVYDLKGRRTGTIGGWGDGKGEFNHPVDIFVDGNGEIYVTDTLNYRIQIFDHDGNYVNKIGRHGDGSGDFGRPKGVAVDPDGHIYVVDAVFDTVQVFDSNGAFLLNFGEIGGSPGKFWLPCGIYIDDDGRIYVADSYNRRVQIFEYLKRG